MLFACGLALCQGYVVTLIPAMSVLNHKDLHLILPLALAFGATVPDKHLLRALFGPA